MTERVEKLDVTRTSKDVNELTKESKIWEMIEEAKSKGMISPAISEDTIYRQSDGFIRRITFMEDSDVLSEGANVQHFGITTVTASLKSRKP